MSAYRSSCLFSAGCKKDPERRAGDCLNVKRKCSTSGAELSDLRTRVVSPCGAGRTTCIWGLEEIFPAKHEPVVVIGQIFKQGAFFVFLQGYRIKKIPGEALRGFSVYVSISLCYTIPCAIMALATFMKPATLAPFT